MTSLIHHDSIPAAVGDLTLRVMMADDDPQEHLLMSMAADRSAVPLNLEFVRDGAELLLALSSIERLDDLPNVIILDLRMPRFDGQRTLAELQAHPVFWQIPVVVFTTSSRPSDEAGCYRGGARWFQIKPSSFSEMDSFISTLERFAADPWTYQACGTLDLSIFNADFAADIEDSLLSDWEAISRGRH